MQSAVPSARLLGHVLFTAAHEARIYWDNGTGTVSYASPAATVAMNNPTEEASYSWDSGVLTDEQEYLFVLRIATAAQPGRKRKQLTVQSRSRPQ